jgi:exodeoxyribonuclease-3
MKIATFNVNGVNGRLPRVLEWSHESQPDIACLQDLKTPDSTFPAAALRDASYAAFWHGQPSYNGLAILNRKLVPNWPKPEWTGGIEARRG